MANHMALCQVHHNTVTGKFDYKFKPGDSQADKLNWIAKERARAEILADRKFPAVKVLRYRDG